MLRPPDDEAGDETGPCRRAEPPGAGGM